MKSRLGLVSLLLVVVLVAPGPRPAAATPDGQLTWALAVSLAPAWFDPADATGILTPFIVLYALHDALVKPMPGKPMAPSLAESWSVSGDGLTYEFVLRPGVRFHNGDLMTADERQVLVRALPWRVGQDAQGTGEAGAGRRPAPRAFQRALRGAQAQGPMS